MNERPVTVTLFEKKEERYRIELRDERGFISIRERQWKLEEFSEAPDARATWRERTGRLVAIKRSSALRIALQIDASRPVLAVRLVLPVEDDAFGQSLRYVVDAHGTSAPSATSSAVVGIFEELRLPGEPLRRGSGADRSPYWRNVFGEPFADALRADAYEGWKVFGFIALPRPAMMEFVAYFRRSR
jgi:hypothetical protein